MRNIGGISVYTVHSDCYRCVYSAKDTPVPSVYVVQIDKHKVYDELVPDYSRSRATAKLCLKHTAEHSKVYVITTCASKWEKQDNRFGLFDVVNHKKCLDLREIIDDIQPLHYTGLLVVSLEKSLEIPIEFFPINTNKASRGTRVLEMYSEGVFTRDSIGLECIYGNSWVVCSENWEFLQIWEYFHTEALVLVCSCSVDFDTMSDTLFPTFYGLFPFTKNPEFLLKRVANREEFLNVKLEGDCVCSDESSGLSVLRTEFDINEYDPELLNTGIHDYITAAALRDNCMRIVEEKKENSKRTRKRGTSKSIANIANSLLSNKRKRN